jgi:hypothetical protein
LNSEGIQAFNSAGLKTVNIDSSTGNVTIAGSFRSSVDNLGAVTIGQSGNVGRIRFYSPDGTTYSQIFSFDDSTVNGASADLKLRSSADDNGVYSMAALLENRYVAGRLSVNNGMYQYDGGGFYADNTVASIFYDPGTAVNQAAANCADFRSNYSIIGYKRGEADEQTLWLSEDKINFLGTFPDFEAPVGTNQALFTGSNDATAGSSSISLGYGATMASQLLPIISIRDDVQHSYSVTAADTDGFTVTISPAGSGVWAIYYWCFRI